MVQNNILVEIARNKTSQKDLAGEMPDGVNPVVMSFIVAGRVMPTRAGMQKMCDVLRCVPTDLYALADLDLTLAEPASKEPKPPGDDAVEADGKAAGKRRRTSHEGMEEFRVWMKPDEKAALIKASNALGYHSLAEWLREMYRKTIRQYMGQKFDEGRTTITEQALKEPSHNDFIPQERSGNQTL